MKKLISFFAFCLGLVLLSAFGRPTGGYQVGDTATDFRLKNVDGKLLSLADNQAAKGYIVVFTCNTCPYAQAYESRIIDLHHKFAPQGYPVVAINPNALAAASGESFEQMQARAASKKYPFPYLLDETQSVAQAYGATRTPHLYVLTRQSNALKVAYIGAIDDNSEEPTAVKTRYVENALAEIIAGKPASTSSTKAVGCTIKWKKA